MTDWTTVYRTHWPYGGVEYGADTMVRRDEDAAKDEAQDALLPAVRILGTW
jgi:hypothetical protein